MDIRSKANLNFYFFPWLFFIWFNEKSVPTVNNFAIFNRAYNWLRVISPRAVLSFHSNWRCQNCWLFQPVSKAEHRLAIQNVNSLIKVEMVRWHLMTAFQTVCIFFVFDIFHWVKSIFSSQMAFFRWKNRLSRKSAIRFFSYYGICCEFYRNTWQIILS